MFAAGDLVAGKFQIDRVIGRGGMGIVVAATHVHLGQRVALKFLLPEVAHDHAVVERFLREARASAQLRSEHICRVSDVGMLDDAPYFVMELLEGRDLASMLTAHGPFPAAIAADYVVQACLGLAEAHAAQIIHRDLKPANLFVTRRTDGVPLIKVVDFGIAKAAAGTDFALTRTDAVMGSPGYMSPEQLRSSRAADARSDIWALGAILFELTTGRQPFTAESLTDLALRIGMDPTPVLHGPSIPPGFDRVVYRCLEKDPARRFQDVAQLASALAPFGGATTRDRALGVARVLSGPQSAGATTPPVDSASTTLGGSAVSLSNPSRSRWRRGVALGAVAAGAIAAGTIVTIAAVAMHRSSGGTEPHVTVTTDPPAPGQTAPGAMPTAAPSPAEPASPPAPSPAPPAPSPAPSAPSPTPSAPSPTPSAPSPAPSAPSPAPSAPSPAPSAPSPAPSAPSTPPAADALPPPAPSRTSPTASESASLRPAAPRPAPSPATAPSRPGPSPSASLPSRSRPSTSSGSASSSAASLPSGSAHPPPPPPSSTTTTAPTPSPSTPAARPSTPVGEPAGSGHAGSGSAAQASGGVRRDAGPRRDPAPPTRRPTPPHPSPAAGSDEDVGASRK